MMGSTQIATLLPRQAARMICEAGRIRVGLVPSVRRTKLSDRCFRCLAFGHTVSAPGPTGTRVAGNAEPMGTSPLSVRRRSKRSRISDRSFSGWKDVPRRPDWSSR